MLQRRIGWAPLVVLSLSAFGGGLEGCRGESGVDQPGAASGALTLNIVPSKHAGQLLQHVESTFRVTSPQVKNKKSKKTNVGKTMPMLTASPITQFTVDGDVIHPVLPAPRKSTPIPTIGLPSKGDGAVTMAISGVSVSVRPRGFAATAVEWTDHLAVYPDVEPGTHAYRRVDATGIEDFYEVATPRETVSFTYDVALDGVAGLRLVGDSLELLDASGTPRLATTAPVAVDTHGVRRIGHLAVSGCAYDTNPAGPWGRAVTAPGNTTCVLTATIDAKGLAFPVLVNPAWRPTFNTKQSHVYHKMLVIPAGADAGKVLLVGGDGSAPTTTELFDPASNSWAASATIPDASGLGEGCNAVVLPDGTVILAGGFPTSGTTTSNAKSTVLKRTPAGAWSFAATMSSPRAWFSMHVVTVGGKAQVLAAGGQKTDDAFTTPPVKTAELYDASIDSWIALPAMKAAHARAGSAVLSDGRVLVAGGYTIEDTAAKVVDVFNPATSTWVATPPSLASARGAPIVVAVSTGAAVFGGFDDSFDVVSQDTIEYFDGTGFTTLTAKLTEGRAYGAGVAIDDGRILVPGGQNSVDDGSGFFINGATDSADLFAPGSDPKTGTVVGTVAMGTPRRWHSLVNLTGKGALATGGDDGSAPTTLSELFDTVLGRACGTGCPTGTFCTEGVCCSTASCPEGQTCATPGHEGVCTKPKGSTCASGSECATGHCADGVCCDTTCLGDCSSCNTAGKVGTCTLAAEGTDPKGRCFDSTLDDPGCGSACDGAGSCGFYPPEGTACVIGGGDASSDTGLFCKHYSCDGFGTCGLNTFDCGLTCTTSTTCDEATKTCSASASGIKAGYCVIDSTCYTYGDINPKNSCQMCDPTATGSKTAWSVATSCKEGGVDDTGTADTGTKDTGTKDTGAKDGGADTSSALDTGTAPDDTGASDDAGAPDNTLPEQSACSCDVPGNDRGPSLATGLALALAGVLVARRRRR